MVTFVYIESEHFKWDSLGMIFKQCVIFRSFDFEKYAIA